MDGSEEALNETPQAVEYEHNTTDSAPEKESLKTEVAEDQPSTENGAITNSQPPEADGGPAELIGAEVPDDKIASSEDKPAAGNESGDNSNNDSPNAPEGEDAVQAKEVTKSPQTEQEDQPRQDDGPSGQSPKEDRKGQSKAKDVEDEANELCPTVEAVADEPSEEKEQKEAVPDAVDHHAGGGNVAEKIVETEIETVEVVRYENALETGKVSPAVQGVVKQQENECTFCGSSCHTQSSCSLRAPRRSYNEGGSEDKPEKASLEEKEPSGGGGDGMMGQPPHEEVEEPLYDKSDFVQIARFTYGIFLRPDVTVDGVRSLCGKVCNSVHMTYRDSGSNSLIATRSSPFQAFVAMEVGLGKTHRRRVLLVSCAQFWEKLGHGMKDAATIRSHLEAAAKMMSLPLVAADVEEQSAPDFFHDFLVTLIVALTHSRYTASTAKDEECGAASLDHGYQLELQKATKEDMEKKMRHEEVEMEKLLWETRQSLDMFLVALKKELVECRIRVESIPNLTPQFEHQVPSFTMEDLCQSDPDIDKLSLTELDEKYKSYLESKYAEWENSIKTWEWKKTGERVHEADEFKLNILAKLEDAQRSAPITDQFLKLFAMDKEEVVLLSLPGSINRTLPGNGTLYLTRNYLTYHSKIVTKTTKDIIPLDEVTSVEESSHSVFFECIRLKLDGRDKDSIVSGLQRRSEFFSLLELLVGLKRRKRKETQTA